MNFLQPLSAQAQHARKIYTSAASKHDVSTLFGIDYMSRYKFSLKDSLKAVIKLWTEVYTSRIWLGRKLS